MKYIMAEASQGSVRRKIPFIFPNDLVHIEVAASFKTSLQTHGWTDIEFPSAGIVTLFGGAVTCGGGSSTLGVQHAQEDARVIEMYDYLHGL